MVYLMIKEISPSSDEVGYVPFFPFRYIFNTTPLRSPGLSFE
jgi:hypothetical protein